jgi:acetolactate synthase-1/2/3 large subunit
MPDFNSSTGYGEIKRYMQNSNIPLIGVDIYTPDFLALARGFGCHAERASSFEHLRALLQTAARAERPTLIELLEDAGFMADAVHPPW